MKTFYLAALLTITSGLLFTFSHSIIKQVNYIGPDIHPLEIAFFSNVFSALFYLPIIIKSNFGILRTDKLSKHVSRAFFNSGALTCFYAALVLTELADVIALSLTGPIFVTLGALIFLGEVVTAKRWLAIIGGGIGALIIIRPGFEEMNLGFLFVLLSAGFAAGSKLFAKLRNAEYLHRLYLEKNKEYMKYLYAFKERFASYDVLVMNPGVDLVHPEFLIENFPDALKCLHFVDDPHSTYSYCFPFSWAFDCATYISPSYSESFDMKQILELSGFKNTKWFPLCNSNISDPIYSSEDLEKQIDTRLNKVIYVGNYYKDKHNRIVDLKKTFKDKLDVYGHYPLKGHFYWMQSILKGEMSLYRVNKITDKKREEYYSKYSIALNLHLSQPSLETGNARLYEVAYRGLAQVADTSRFSKVEDIFIPEKEILLYENGKECIQQIKRLMSDLKLKKDIAIAGYNRAVKDYNYERNLLEILDWFKGLNANENF